MGELSRSRPPIVIIRMSEFKAGGTYIYALLHIIRIIRYFIVIQYFSSLGDIMQLKKNSKI